MLNITRFAVENLTEGCVTDAAQPRFTFTLGSDSTGVTLRSAKLEVNGWQTDVDTQTGVAYGGEPLKPFTRYEATLTATDDAGETASAALTFETGRLGQPWQAQWISDPTYQFTEKKVSPIPMLFRKQISVTKPVASARLYATALGIYELTLNGKKVGDQYFAPGFTSYKSQLQYQTYDVTDLLTGDTTLLATVAGGWAVGSFVFTRKNRITVDRQALLADVIDHIEFTSGIRTDGLTMSIYSSLMVASTPIMNAVFMAMLGSGYDAAATAQTAAVQSTITVSYIWVETIAFAVDALLVLFFTVEKNLPAEQAAIAERKKG